MTARLWLGAQGWLYKDWLGPFYPPGTSDRDMLAEYSRVFSTVEVDSTYYATPAPTVFEGWHRRTPDGFRFSLKAPSAVTHVHRFRDDAPAAFAEFVERVRLLGAKVGAILLQCPPDFAPSPDNRAALAAFVTTHLPRDMRVALELRDETWYDADLFSLARAAGFALAITEGSHASLALAGSIADALERQPATDFAYLRWIGDRSLARFDRVQRDRTASLDAWERIVRALRRNVRDIYGYANNHYQGHSPATIRAVLARMGEAPLPETTAPRLL